MASVLERVRRMREGRRCEEARERLGEIIDAEMPAGRKRRRIEKHLRNCYACGADAEWAKQLKEAVSRVGRDPDPVVKARLLAVVDEIRSLEEPGDRS